jgi:predicted nucleotide-binding protein
LLSHFYKLRHNRGGYVPVSDMILGGTEGVTLEAIRGVCRQLDEAGLIEWTGHLGQGPEIGVAKITGLGVDAIETGRSPRLEIRFPEARSSDLPAAQAAQLKRDWGLIGKLLLKLEHYPRNPVTSGVTLFRGNEPELAVEGYSAEQITFNLAQLRELGLIDSPGSRPGLGVTFRGLSPKGYAFLEEQRAQSASMPNQVDGRKAPLSRKVFIVHGHEGEPREAVAGFLRKIDFAPVILHEQTNRGRTIVEKFEDHSDVDFAVVLLTPDDIGSPKGGTLQSRARQNVILELGYFIGKLGRDKVCAMKLGDLEIPSDIIGVVWTPFDEHGAWKTALARELKDAGHEIDWEKVMGP